LPLHLLVTLGARERLPGGSPRFDERLQAASREWKLTPRQTAVLERVVRGDSNKQIAERLRCTENTIEVHVSALLRKAAVDSRVTLAVEFWTAVGS
jgi:DNA-binding NarL/FixJ family response regulator